MTVARKEEVARASAGSLHEGEHLIETFVLPYTYGWGAGWHPIKSSIGVDRGHPLVSSRNWHMVPP